MAINKIPKNYYSDTNIRRDKINEIIDEVNDIASIPSPSAEDAGKVVKVSEDGEYELADDAGTVLPAPTIADSGKIIKVSDEGSYELADDEGTVLPAPTIADSGKIIKVGDEGSYELADDEGTVLPVPTAADAGKVLGVDSTGAWELTSDIVTIRYDATAGGPVLSKNIEDVINTINDGRMVDFVYGNNHYTLTQISNSEMTIHNIYATTASVKKLFIQQIVFNRSTGVGVYTESYCSLT